MEENKEVVEEVNNNEEPLGKFLLKNLDLIIIFIVGTIVLIFDLVKSLEYRMGLLILALGLGIMGSRGYHTTKVKAGLVLEVLSFILVVILLISHILSYYVS